MPTLNYHSSYAGVTSGVKCHIGFAKKIWAGGESLHSVGYSDYPWAVGEAVGELITNVVHPLLYITVAEYSGHRGRTSSTTTHTKTIGLCRDLVSLDYWMAHNVLAPCGGSYQEEMDPMNDNPFRQTLAGAQQKGLGTLNEGEMGVHVYDYAHPSITRVDIDRKIMTFKEGRCNQEEVVDLIKQYMQIQ